jgi:integrase
MFAGKVNGKRANDRSYTHQEISKLLEGATLRQKVVVLLMCSAGLRAGAIPSLRVSHLRKIPQYGIYQPTVYFGDAAEEYVTFCTPECAVAIDSYMQYRKDRLGETEETPLVVNLVDKEYNYNDRNVGGVTSPEVIKRIVYRLLYDSGVRRLEDKKIELGARHLTATCHSLRKFFRSQLHFAGVDHLHAETLVCHSTGLVGIYTKIPDEELLRSYVTAINHLTINEEARLQAKVKKLTAEQDRIMKKLNKIDALAEKLGITDDDKE